VQSGALDAGDVHVFVGDRLAAVIERKTIPDLAASMCDGRLREQKARLQAMVLAARHDAGGTDEGLAVVYVIEGASWTWGDGLRLASNVRASSLQGTVLSIALAGNRNRNRNRNRTRTPPGSVGDAKEDSALPAAEGDVVDDTAAEADDAVRSTVVWTRDVEDTAAFVCRLANHLARQAPPGGTPGTPGTPGNARASSSSKESYQRAACAAVSVKKRGNLDHELCFLQQLCQIPGVSPRLAAVVAKGLEVTCMAELVRKLSADTPVGKKTPAGKAGGRGKGGSASSSSPWETLGRLPGVGDKTVANFAAFLFGGAPASTSVAPTEAPP
jgi:ERCC4-type nuclease